MADRDPQIKASSRGWGEMLGFFIFVSLFLSLICAGIGVVISVLYSPDSSIGWGYILGSVLFALFLIVSQFITHVNHSRPMFPLYLISSISLAVFFYSFLVSIISGPILLLLYLIGIKFHELPVPDFFRVLPIVIIGAFITYGSINARVLRRRKVTLPLLKEDQRFRIALISDLHLGLLVGKTRLDAIMKTLRKEKPDIIVLAGDFLDTNPRFLDRFRSFVKEMVSLSPVYSVTGNHEFYNGLRDSMDWLRSLGVNSLDNRSMRDPNTGIELIGIHDPSAFKDGEEYNRMHQTLIGDAERTRTTILVNHQPLLFRKAAEMGIDLQLSGHTHAGQMWPFGLGTKAIFKEGYKGLNKWKDSYLYVCQGTGTWGPPLRIGTSSEIVIIDMVEKK
jgi:hypothetical protein